MRVDEVDPLNSGVSGLPEVSEVLVLLSGMNFVFELAANL